MSSVRDSKQRAAARAKLEREMAARRDAARRKRLMQAGYLKKRLPLGIGWAEAHPQSRKFY